MNKKLLFLLGVYASGIAVATLYNRKSPDKIQKELDETKLAGKSSCKVLFNNFLDIHKNFLDDMKKEVLTQENKEKFVAKKEDIQKALIEYRLEGEKLLKDLEVKGKDYASDAMERLEDEYNKRVAEFKKKAPEKVDELKERLNDYYDDVKSKIKSKK